MFKIIVITIMTLLPFKVGLDMQKALGRRKTDLYELCNFFSCCKREVIFSRRRISEVFQDNLPLLTRSLRVDFEKNIQIIPEIGLHEFFSRLSLDDTDKKILLDFADSISKTEEAFDNLIALLQEQKQSATEVYTQNGKLYRQIGLASGLILGILFI
jgi:stage III sporulation protein AB